MVGLRVGDAMGVCGRDKSLGLQVSVGTNLVLHFNGSVYKPRTFTP